MFGDTQLCDIIIIQPAVTQPQHPDPAHMTEVRCQCAKTSSNQLVPGDIHLFQVGEELKQRDCGRGRTVIVNGHVYVCVFSGGIRIKLLQTASIVKINN